MPKFSVVADNLKKIYKNSRKVTNIKILREIYKNSVKVTKGKKQRLRPRRLKNDVNLVYNEDSPSYCEPNKSLGIRGVGGRLCNPNEYNGTLSCSVLCCEYGYDKERRRTHDNCKCTFHWCCTVKCQKCNERIVNEFRCKRPALDSLHSHSNYER